MANPFIVARFTCRHVRKWKKADPNVTLQPFSPPMSPALAGIFKTTKTLPSANIGHMRQLCSTVIRDFRARAFNTGGDTIAGEAVR